MLSNRLKKSKQYVEPSSRMNGRRIIGQMRKGHPANSPGAKNSVSSPGE
jgi:hypothetical protein